MAGRSNIRVFALCKIVEIKWRERDYKPVRDASLHDEGVRDTLNLLWVAKVYEDSAYAELGFVDANSDRFLGCC